jgi:hypothetical protein
MLFRDLATYLLLLCAAGVAVTAELQAIGGLKHQAAIIAGHMIVAVLE